MTNLACYIWKMTFYRLFHYSPVCFIRLNVLSMLCITYNKTLSLVTRKNFDNVKSMLINTPNIFSRRTFVHVHTLYSMQCAQLELENFFPYLFIQSWGEICWANCRPAAHPTWTSTRTGPTTSPSGVTPGTTSTAAKLRPWSAWRAASPRPARFPPNAKGATSCCRTPTMRSAGCSPASKRVTPTPNPGVSTTVTKVNSLLKLGSPICQYSAQRFGRNAQRSRFRCHAWNRQGGLRGQHGLLREGLHE